MSFANPLATLLNIRTESMVLPAAIVDNDDPVGARGDANPVSVDTVYNGRKADAARVRLRLGATDIAMGALAVYEGATVASGADDADYTLISSTAFSGTTGDGRLPTATDDGEQFAVYIDLKDRERHLLLEALVGNGSTGSFVTAEVDLLFPGESLTTATDRGNGGELIAGS